jgi:hypothetical protein
MSYIFLPLLKWLILLSMPKNVRHQYVDILDHVVRSGRAGKSPTTLLSVSIGMNGAVQKKKKTSYMRRG